MSCGVSNKKEQDSISSQDESVSASIVEEIPASDKIGKWDIYNDNGITPYITMGVDYPSYKVVFMFKAPDNFNKNGQAEMRIVAKTNDGFKQMLTENYEITFGDLKTIIPTSDFVVFPETDIQKVLEYLEQGSFNITAVNEDAQITYKFTIQNQTKGARDAWNKLERR